MVSWLAATDNGSTVTSYTITFKQSDNNFSADTTNCDGSDAGIMSALSCTVPFSVFTSAPFSLSYGNQVYAKVLATNANGSSTASAESNGVAIPSTTPDAPINLQVNESSRTADSFEITWTAGASDGGASISGY